MLIIPTSKIHSLMEAIVNATHGTVDQDGERVNHGTIDPSALRMAALNAISHALGQTVWPADQRITMPKPRPAPGPFAA
jgi:hypothetical protein